MTDTPKLTDEAVGRLPLHAARAELLEEIVSTPVLDDQSVVPRSDSLRRHARWLVPLAAAASVAALVTAVTWWPTGDDGGRQGGELPVASEPPDAGEGHRAVLDAPGWSVVSTSEDAEHGGEIGYAKGDLSLDVTWYPATSYETYVDDREHILEPPAPGEPVEVLGIGGQLWHYSADDHTVIREVQDGWWMEFRGSGMDDAAYRTLLGQLRLVDEAGFEAALPPTYIGSGERAEEIRRLLDEITAVSGAGMPAGSRPPTSEETDPYHLGADVAGGYACAWLDVFATGGAEQRQRAAEVLSTSHDWPVLQRMNERGDYPEVLWEYADAVVAGEVPQGYDMGLGC